MQVGACIVNQENKIVGIGYNGMPNGCNDDLLPWSRSADDRLDTKYPYGESTCPSTRTPAHMKTMNRGSGHLLSGVASLEENVCAVGNLFQTVCQMYLKVSPLLNLPVSARNER